MSKFVCARFLRISSIFYRKKENFMAKFFCKYCGLSFASVFALSNARCLNHPVKGGNHQVYEGSEKPKYTCKHCGLTFPTIWAMTHISCLRRLDKGSHEPML